MDDIELNRLLTIKQVADLMGCSTRHIERQRAAGLFPQGVKSGHLRRWPRHQIRAYYPGK